MNEQKVIEVEGMKLEDIKIDVDVNIPVGSIISVEQYTKGEFEDMYVVIITEKLMLIELLPRVYTLVKLDSGQLHSPIRTIVTNFKSSKEELVNGKVLKDYIEYGFVNWLIVSSIKVIDNIKNLKL